VDQLLRFYIYKAGIALSEKWLGLTDQGIGVRFLGESRDFSLYHYVHKGSEVYPASNPMDTMEFFSGIKQSGRESHYSVSFTAGL
jgi:hypothetical protein